MKVIIKKIISLLGLEIRRKQSNTIDLVNGVINTDKIHRNNMEASLYYIKSRGYTPDTIIDIGAGNGTVPLLNVFPNSRHLLFEPLVEFEEEIKKLKDFYNLDYRICAIGRYEGKVSINVHPDLYGTSLLKEQDGAIADGTKRDIEMISLQKVEDIFKLKENASLLLKLDVQGAELEVLKSGEHLLHKADVVIIECSFFKFLIDGADITEVIIYMKNNGFVIYEMFDFHNRPFDNALAQADLIFVKENGLFRTSNNWATQEQRALVIN